MDCSNELSSEGSGEWSSEDSGEGFVVEEDVNVIVNVIQPYMFEPESDCSEDADSDDMASQSSSNSGDANSRLQDTNWCLCGHCQIMDREDESVCCLEISTCIGMNEEAAQIENIPIPECVTDNPGFQAVCLNYWVLQVAWNHYRQQYGTNAYDGPEHKKQRHIAYRQFVRWCWGILGKDIRVPLPSCAVSCIRAHFPPPGLEDDFVFEGFRYADD